MIINYKKELQADARFLKIRAGVRYWEDSTVNGVEDENGELIPCKDGENWCPLIDIDSGKIVNWQTGKKATIHYKVCDDGDYWIQDADNEDLIHLEGYVPGCLGKDGDYIVMKIDENGSIMNWDFDVNDFLPDQD